MAGGETPHDCFLVVQPLLGDVVRHLMKAPLDIQGRAGLAIEVAVFFVSNAAAEMAKADTGATDGTMPAPKFFRQVIEIIASDIERGGRLQS